MLKPLPAIDHDKWDYHSLNEIGLVATQATPRIIRQSKEHCWPRLPSLPEPPCFNDPTFLGPGGKWCVINQQRFKMIYQMITG